QFVRDVEARSASLAASLPPEKEVRRECKLLLEHEAGAGEVQAPPVPREVQAAEGCGPAYFSGMEMIERPVLVFEVLERSENERSEEALAHPFRQGIDRDDPLDVRRILR